MVSVLPVFLFSLPFLAVARFECSPSDAQCLAGQNAEDSEMVDINSMIQANTIATVQDAVLKPEESSENIVAAIDLGHKALNATAQGANIFADQYLHGSWKHRLVWGIFSWAIYVVLALLIWFVAYPERPIKVENIADIEDPKDTLTNGHFGCMKNKPICLCACFCPGLRWADTMDMFSLVGITMGLSLVFICSLLNGVTYYGNAIVGPFTILLALYFRHRLREKLGLPSWTLGSCCLDFWYIFCCPWCAIAQEARTATHRLQRGEGDDAAKP